MSVPSPPESEFMPGVTVGRHTYGHDESTFRTFMASARVEVGAFCSFGPEVRVLAGSEHILDRPSTFPFRARVFDPAGGNATEAIDRGPTIIGSDVWLGLGATVMSGVLVGDGAAIGAGSVVSRSVPPYAVVVGNPARVIRFRFGRSTRERLLQLGWWSWSDEQIEDMLELFEADVETFLREAERRHGRLGESEVARRIAALPRRRLTPMRRATWPLTRTRRGRVRLGRPHLQRSSS